MRKAVYQCDACGEEWPCVLFDAMLEDVIPEHCPFAVGNKADWRVLIPEVDKCPGCGSDKKNCAIGINKDGSRYTGPLPPPKWCDDKWHVFPGPKRPSDED